MAWRKASPDARRQTSIIADYTIKRIELNVEDLKIRGYWWENLLQ